MHSQLLIGSLVQSAELKAALESHLDNQRYRIHFEELEDDFFQWIGKNRHRVDCLVLQPSMTLSKLLETLRQRDILVPALILQSERGPEKAPSAEPGDHQDAHDYHSAIAYVPKAEFSQIERYVHQSIAQFLKLSLHQPIESSETASLTDTRNFLLSLQQQRLSEKLQERLGYLGVYYKRNPESFLRHLSPEERTALLDELRRSYRAIILEYFVESDALNSKIDDMVNTAFLADVSVSQIVEIHMDLMESFSKQLKLEGRSEEILLDYRLTLIDVIAHLCEMYRRSIPRDV